MIPRSIEIAPFWRVVGADAAPTSDSPNTALVSLRLANGPGFGRGDHETTQLCLQALGHLLRGFERTPSVLDFGSGSGILSIAAALRGARVWAVEIEPSALEHGRVNAELNGVSASIESSQRLPDTRRFDVIVANILCSVLLEHASALCARLVPGGSLVLSGLVATDVPAIVAGYRPLLAGSIPSIHERGAWRAVLFRSAR